MRRQYLARIRRSSDWNDALESQRGRLHLQPYPLPCESHMMRSRNTHVSLTSEPGLGRRVVVSGSFNIDRRFTCPRASSCWQPSVSLQRFRPARSKKKSLSWSSPSPSRLSPSTPASTSNAVAGQAFAPALIPATPATGRGV